ncbi:MAG: hypothetical protein ACON5C_03810 [Alphaproteobacteria bacterium]
MEWFAEFWGLLLIMQVLVLLGLLLVFMQARQLALKSQQALIKNMTDLLSRIQVQEAMLDGIQEKVKNLHAQTADRDVALADLDTRLEHAQEMMRNNTPHQVVGSSVGASEGEVAFLKRFASKGGPTKPRTDINPSDEV